jgi:hypothetical protein
MAIRAAVLLCLLLAPSLGMAQDNNASAAVPSLTGVLLVQWNDERRFIYVGDPTKPLQFHGSDGRQINPGRMYTDGGSIPRVFWAFPGFSPWGYAPAYVVHDWLFHQHRCHSDSAPNNYTLAQANQVLNDIIEILFDKNVVERNETARALIKWAVDHYAQSAWDAACDAVPPPLDKTIAALPFVVTVARLSLGN